MAQTPPPRVGFQMDIRTGYSLPMGTAAETLAMSDVVSGQVPLIVDIGAKLMPQLFIGGYLGFGFGGAGGRGKTNCDANGFDCTAMDLHIGIEAQYHILPAGAVNPWIGYGLGWESLSMSTSAGGVTRSSSVSGFEFARLMGGVDFRVLTRVRRGPVRRSVDGDLQLGLQWRHDQRHRHPRVADARRALRIFPVRRSAL